MIYGNKKRINLDKTDDCEVLADGRLVLVKCIKEKYIDPNLSYLSYNFEIKYDLKEKKVTKNIKAKYTGHVSKDQSSPDCSSTYCVEIYKSFFAGLSDDELGIIIPDNFNKNKEIPKDYLSKKIKLKNSEFYTRKYYLEENFTKTFINDIIEGRDQNYKIEKALISKNNGKEHSLDLTDNEKIFKFLSNNEEIKKLFKEAINSVIKSIVDSNDYGLDEGIIYLGILANLDREGIKNIGYLNLYKCSNKPNLDSFSYEYFDKILSGKNKNDYNDMSIMIIPSFRGSHAMVLIFNKECDKLIALDSLDGICIDNTYLLNEGYSFQLAGDNGCCGFFTYYYVSEILNNLEKYKPIFCLNKKEEEKRKEVLRELNIRTIVNVSNTIDGKDSNIFKKIGPKEDIKDFKINNKSRSKCIDIENFSSYLEGIKQTGGAHYSRGGFRGNGMHGEGEPQIEEEELSNLESASISLSSLDDIKCNR